MGFWKKSLNVVQDMTSLGGTIWLREQIKRHEALRSAYELIRNEISKGNARLISVIHALEEQVQISDKRLTIAERILNPLRRDVILPPSKNSSSAIFSFTTVSYADFEACNKNNPRHSCT